MKLTNLRIQAVGQFKRPKTKKDVKVYLGLTGYYRKFIPNHAEHYLPFTQLLKKSQPDKVQWSLRLEDTFIDLKTTLVTKPMLQTPDFKDNIFFKPMHLGQQLEQC